MNPGPAALDPAYDLLISYRRADGSFARQLADRLSQQHGLRVFLDEKAHVPGYHWREFWTRALRSVPRALQGARNRAHHRAHAT